MRVTDVKTFVVYPGTGKNWLFVKVETDEGIHGWGEAYTQADRDKAIEVHVHQMRRYLLGRSPFNIKHFCHVMYHDYAGKRGAMEFYCALSGIEQALWDIVGKATGQPVYNLLGGACRSRIRVYANGWGGNGGPETMADQARKVIGQGFSALKFDPFPGPWRSFISRSEEDVAVERVAAVREAVGPDVEILVEVHRRLAPMHAIRVAERMSIYRPFWYEEPVSARNLDALVAARQGIRLPVVTGEELYTKHEFREVLERRAADILNPDICNTGGILELKEIAAMAEPYEVVISPHCYNSTTVGLAATVHLCACIPNFLITEYFVNFETFGKTVADTPPLAEGGYIPLPTKPGLGLDLDEAALQRHAYREFPLRHIRQVDEEGP